MNTIEMVFLRRFQPTTIAISSLFSPLILAISTLVDTLLPLTLILIDIQIAAFLHCR
jgi:hypothetical protein